MNDAQEALPNPNPAGSELPPEASIPIDPASIARHYEQDDVDVRALVRYTVIIAVAGGIASVLLWVVLRIWTEQPLPIQIQIPPAEVTVPAVPGPGLDAIPEVNLVNILQRDNERLNSYGWVDRDAGVVHIPIDEAMRLMVEHGVPAREGEAPDFQLEPAFRLDSSGGVMPAAEDGTDE
jgi:hypothetical protein